MTCVWNSQCSGGMEMTELPWPNTTHRCGLYNKKIPNPPLSDMVRKRGWSVGLTMRTLPCVNAWLGLTSPLPSWRSGMTNLGKHRPQPQIPLVKTVYIKLINRQCLCMDSPSVSRTYDTLHTCPWVCMSANPAALAVAGREIRASDRTRFIAILLIYSQMGNYVPSPRLSRSPSAAELVSTFFFLAIV
jgi:hypothetical protein